MSYFNHAYKKSFVATKATVAASGTPGEANAQAGVTNGLLVTEDIHVSNLKSTAASEGYQLGPGVLGLFDAGTHLSALGATIGQKPFYLGGASLKLNDKQGPFHGGYQASNKSKVINPKYLRKMWKVVGNAASAAVVEVGETQANTDTGAVLTAETAPSGGTNTGYSADTDVATTGGSGTGLTVDITVSGDAITVIAINNPGVGYEAADVITITGGDDATFVVSTVSALASSSCDTAFLCGETYYLRVDVKGTPALRFANHNLYETLQADGGCCADPSSPVEVNAIVIYKQWAETIAESIMLKDFVRPILVADGQAYAYDAESAVAEGLDPATELFANAPAAPTNSGIILKGAYVDTTFGDCTFQCSEYFGIEPIQIQASEVDLSGDPCSFSGVCVVERCQGYQANGTGEQKVRDLVLSESYLQNFMSNDLRIREITQGTRAYEVLDRATIYSSMYILHSVPRYNNPSGVFDNDQYLLEIVGPAAMLGTLETELEAITTAAGTGVEVEDLSSVESCSFVVPNP